MVVLRRPHCEPVFAWLNGHAPRVDVGGGEVERNQSPRFVDGVREVRVGEVFGRVPQGNVPVSIAPSIIVAEFVLEDTLAPGDHLAHRAADLVDRAAHAGVLAQIWQPRRLCPWGEPQLAGIVHEPDRYDSRKAIGSDRAESHDVASFQQESVGLFGRHPWHGPTMTQLNDARPPRRCYVRFMASIDDIRDEFKSWLNQHWNPDMTVRQWWAAMADAGWQFPHWPEGLGGRGLTQAESRAVSAELVDAGAIGPPFSLGQVMGGPVVLQNGNDEQRARLVPPLANGTESWCQFFSEPEAGSDLAGLRTTAERDGEEWIINGQKVWTSGAVDAAKGMLVARSNWDAPKHRGLSYFIIDVDQPGIEIRPLKQMSGGSHFNEVFFSDARVPHENLIGGDGDGWASAVSTLAFERQGLSSRVPGLPVVRPGEKAGLLDRSAGEMARAPEDSGIGAGRTLRSAGAISRLAAEFDRDEEPDIRDDLARLKAMSMTSSWSAQRAREAAKAGQQPGPFANMAKLSGSHISRMARDLGPRSIGAYGMLSGEDSPHDGLVSDMVTSQPSASIAGGTDEVQRNIISERGLGLPKDISVDRDIPFRDVKKSG